MLPHDLQGIPRAIVSSHCIGAVPEDGQGDSLRTARVSQLVLHAVPKRVHCQLLVCDDCAKALHQHGRTTVSASVLGVVWKQGCFWVFALDQLC